MPHLPLDTLVRQTRRSELQAIDHPLREARRLGDSPPIDALRAIAQHATQLRPRFEHTLAGHGIALHRGGVGPLSTLRHLVVDRVVDAERSYRTVLLDLRHGLDVVAALGDVARRGEVFGLIRWCDDWLGARRTLVACAQAQLAWFAEQDGARLRPRTRLATAPEDIGGAPADARAPDAQDAHLT